MKRPISWLGFTSLAIVLGRYFLRRATRLSLPASPEEQERGRRLLTRAAPFIRLPGVPDEPPQVLSDGSGLICPRTGHVYPYKDGILHLLSSSFAPTPAQRSLDTALTSWAYDRFRDISLRLSGLPDFPEEVAAIQSRLAVQPGDRVLDLACGHGNFTVEWAKRVGPEGLVVGLDISHEMLKRAAWHVRRWGLENVLLIQGDAQEMPFADQSFSRVNCSGGFHQFPDLERALREITRVSTPGAHLCASTFVEAPFDRHAALKRWFRQSFSMHFVPVPWLEEKLSALGCKDIHWFAPGGASTGNLFSYLSCRQAG